MTLQQDAQVTIHWAQQVQRLLAKRGDVGPTTGIQAAISQFEAVNFQIAVLGKAKRGKSTLINSLLGRSDDTLAPIDKLPASSAISRFSWGASERVTVTFRNDRQEEILAGQVREFVTEEFNPENQKQVALVTIEGPFAALDRQLTLIDTPGAASLHEHHDALLHAFIPQADAVLFLVTASMPLDQDEIELLKLVKQADIRKIFFVMNKVDDRSNDDVEDAVQHNQLLLAQAGVPSAKIHLLSAKRAFQGDSESSGLAELKAEIDGFLHNHRGRILCERFISRVQSHATPTLLDVSLELSHSLKSTDDLNAELKGLTSKKQSLDLERSLAEREFTRSWDLATDHFNQRLQIARAEVAAELTNKCSETTVIAVSKFGRDLPTLLNQLLEDTLRPIAAEFESATRAATDSLNAAYPAITVTESSGVALKTHRSSTVLVGVMGGGVAASAGMGLVAAGSSIAAGIAAANAAAIATTTTVAAPSLVSGLLTMAGFEFLAPLATGTATVAAPAALTATPLWVALSGPVGWTLAGVGLLAVPFSWRISKLKYKDKLESAAQEQVRHVFDRLQTDRLPALRNMSKSIVEEFRIRLDRELLQIESSLLKARDKRPVPADMAQLEEFGKRLGALLSNGPPIPGHQAKIA